MQRAKGVVQGAAPFYLQLQKDIREKEYGTIK